MVCVSALQTQMRKGFERVASDMPDLQLDLPNAPAAFGEFRTQVQAGCLCLLPAKKSCRWLALQLVRTSCPITPLKYLHSSLSVVAFLDWLDVTPGGGGRLAAGGGCSTAASGRGPCGRQWGGGKRTRPIRGARQPHRDGWQWCHAPQCKWRSFHSGCLRQQHRVRFRLDKIGRVAMLPTENGCSP
jgi:MA3 domain